MYNVKKSFLAIGLILSISVFLVSSYAISDVLSSPDIEISTSYVAIGWLSSVGFLGYFLIFGAVFVRKLPNIFIGSHEMILRMPIKSKILFDEVVSVDILKRKILFWEARFIRIQLSSGIRREIPMNGISGDAAEIVNCLRASVGG